MANAVRRLQLLSDAPGESSRRGTNDLYVEQYPASWFLIAPSSRVTAKKPLAVDAFGERLVVWRGSETGTPYVQSRFCPHMGASLAHGRVVGERISCPFHRWEYAGSSGTCTKIPYMDDARIPRRARIRSFPVVEQDGFVWAFNGAEPTHELPRLSEGAKHGWGVRTKTQRFNAHPLLILENGCDAQHFKYVHKVDYEKYDVVRHDHGNHAFGFDVLQTMRLPGPLAKRKLVITTSLDYVGASLIYGKLAFNDHHWASFIAAPTPVAPNVTDFTLIVAVKSLPWWLSFLNPIFYPLVARQLFTGATDDYFPIWRDMDPTHRGVLVEEDRLQQRFRKYYREHLVEEG